MARLGRMRASKAILPHNSAFSVRLPIGVVGCPLQNGTHVCLCGVPIAAVRRQLTALCVVRC